MLYIINIIIFLNLFFLMPSGYKSRGSPKSEPFLIWGLDFV